MGRGEYGIFTCLDNGYFTFGEYFFLGKKEVRTKVSNKAKG
jgi:hypothetical protein